MLKGVLAGVPLSGWFCTAQWPVFSPSITLAHMTWVETLQMLTMATIVAVAGAGIFWLAIEALVRFF
jgi:hypothetical protein